MDVIEKQRKLENILKRIEYIEEELETITSYYIETPKKINGITIWASLFEIVQHLKQDYQKEVLDEFYDEIETIMTQQMD